MEIEYQCKNGYRELLITPGSRQEAEFLHRFTTPETAVTFHYHKDPIDKDIELIIRKEL